MVISALAALSIAGCGSATRLDFKGHSRASPPVEVSVYVDNTQVNVSPRQVGAGLVTLNVTNQATSAHELEIMSLRPSGEPPSGAPPVAGTKLIAPNGTAQLTVALSKGDYIVLFPHHGGLLKAGPARHAGDSALLQP